jgi:hypothetical protein
VRYWLPLAAAAICLVVASNVSPLLGFVFVIAAFGFVIDASTKFLENAGKSGGLGNHRQ